MSSRNPMRPGARFVQALAAASFCCAAPRALAGGSGESALILVDPSSADARYLANYYKAAREIPDANVLYMDPHAANYTAFVQDAQAGFLGTLAERGIEHVDYVVIMPSANFFVPAPGLVGDGCAPVNRFGLAAPFTLVFNSSAILAGTVSSRPNRYFGIDDAALAFESSARWFNGVPSNQTGAERYFIGALLGYTGLRGNPIGEIIDLVDRSVAIDGAQPAGTFYFCETTDFIRSSPRHGFYPVVTMAINALGGMAQHLVADMPIGATDCQGVMTGLATPNVAGGNFTLLAGSFCDHLTSFAGTFDEGSQTKMSEWITKGASGTSGTVEEPCNYAGKFPHARMHLYYFQGLTLGEAWFRSMRFYPFQNLLYGDPLTRPFAAIPSVDVPDAPAAPISGTVLLHPTASSSSAFPIDAFELYVDGVRLRSGAPGDALPLQTRLLSDGWHELRVLAYDASNVRNVGRWSGSCTVANHGATATLAASDTGDLGSLFDCNVAAPGSTVVELRVVSNGRVLGSTTQNPGTVQIFGQNLGGGPARLQAEAWLANGERVRSEPLDVNVSPSGGGVSGVPPVAYDYHRGARVDLVSVVELPAAFHDPFDTVSYSITAPPAQASAQLAAGYVLLRPTPSANGTDTLRFQVTSPAGTSNEATVTLVYEPAAGCALPSTYCIGAPNSVGPGAAIAFDGSTSVAENDLVLYVDGARPNQPGIFYYGAGQIQVPFGDGFRCVGAGGIGTFRLHVITADAFGSGFYALDLNAPPASSGPSAIQPGGAWNFQYWYRDPGSPGGANFNLSDALAVQFCP